MEDLVMLVKHHIDTDASKLMQECSCAYIQETSLLYIANMINDLGEYQVPIYMDSQPSVDYESSLNAPYGLKYIGLRQGIINTYNKLKNEY
jgi:hypothetical protein